MALLDVRNLSVDYLSEGAALHAVEAVSFTLEKGHSLALVGESGCGKTTAMLALLRLLPANGRIVHGQIQYQGVDLLRLREDQMRQYRWQHIALTFQGAMNALNPVRRIGDQIAEAIREHEITSRAQAHYRVGELLEVVGITPARANEYPHEFSGGMRQRAMIAMALACKPDILIADEPTTALDVMIQAQILDLLQRLQKQLGLSIILVTHDLGVVAELCDEVLVMYGGRMAEYGSVDTIFNHPIHPYTRRLLDAFPRVDNFESRLASIPGYPPSLRALPPGCRFEPRCHLRSSLCGQSSPEMRELRPGQYGACHHPEDITNGAR